jgi:hypothetical protein
MTQVHPAAGRDPAEDGAAEAAFRSIVDQVCSGQLQRLMQSPGFIDGLIAALHRSPLFAQVFADKMGRAFQVPQFANAIAGALMNAPALKDVLDTGYPIAPFKPLFAGDESDEPPGTYNPSRAARQWAHIAHTTLDFVYANRVAGDLYEFGTLNGYTARHFAIALGNRPSQSAITLRLFDTFTGFPEIDSNVDRSSYTYHDNDWQKGGCSTKEGTSERVARMLGTLLPANRFAINVGGFADTLTRDAAPNPAAIIHMDCDLYESTRVVLERLSEFGLLQDGTIIIWDDFNCARANPEFGERRAMHEFFDESPRFSCEHWFAYGWHGQVSFVHERGVAGRRMAAKG